MSAEPSRPDQTLLKQAAARYAVERFIQSGMHVGLGSGSTAELFVEELARQANSEFFSNLITVSTSEKVAALAQTLGLRVVNLDDVPTLDVTVDGADEIEPTTFALTKGRGGALLREKMVAAATTTHVIIADQSKLVNQLGEKMPIPVEIIPFGWHHTAARLRALGCDPVLRMSQEKPYLTDSKNYILDCRFAPITDPAFMSTLIKNVVGVVEHGIFVGLTAKVVIAGDRGVYELARN